MKKFFFGLAFGLAVSFSFSQDLPDFDAIRLEKAGDYNAKANDAALQAAEFLLSTPLDPDNLDRLKSMQYMITWMSGTPDYSFTLDEHATKFTKNNDDFLGLYLAAMTKFMLENKDDAADENKVKLNAMKLVIAYAKDKNNKVKVNGELKKAIEAEDKGKLAEYLKM